VLTDVSEKVWERCLTNYPENPEEIRLYYWKFKFAKDKKSIKGQKKKLSNLYLL